MVIPFVTSQRDLAHFSKKKKKVERAKEARCRATGWRYFTALHVMGCFTGDFSAARAPKQIGSLQVHRWANKYISRALRGHRRSNCIDLGVASVFRLPFQRAVSIEPRLCAAICRPASRSQERARLLTGDKEEVRKH